MANLPIQALWIICRTNNKTDFLFLIIYYSSKTVPYHIFYAFCLRQRKISILLLILSYRSGSQSKGLTFSIQVLRI